MVLATPDTMRHHLIYQQLICIPYMEVTYTHFIYLHFFALQSKSVLKHDIIITSLYDIITYPRSQANTIRPIIPKPSTIQNEL